MPFFLDYLFQPPLKEQAYALNEQPVPKKPDSKYVLHIDIKEEYTMSPQADVVWDAVKKSAQESGVPLRIMMSWDRKTDAELSDYQDTPQAFERSVGKSQYTLYFKNSHHSAKQLGHFIFLLEKELKNKKDLLSTHINVADSPLTQFVSFGIDDPVIEIAATRRKQEKSALYLELKKICQEKHIFLVRQTATEQFEEKENYADTMSFANGRGCFGSHI